MYLYLIQEKRTKGAIKIGVARNVQRRMEALQTGNPNKLEILMAFKADGREHAYQLEKLAHKVFREYRIRGEWFSPKIDLKALRLGNL